MRNRTLRGELEAFASNGGEAFAQTDPWIDDIIKTLSRDPRIKLNRFELDLLLEDHRIEIREQLFRLLVDRVHLDHADVVDGVEHER
jgi:hypothetical protein